MNVRYPLILEMGGVFVVAAIITFLHHTILQKFEAAFLRKHNDVAGFLLSVVGVVYAVVLGFVVVVAWQKFDDTVTFVDDEIAATIDLYHSVYGLTPQVRDAMRADLRAYAATVMDVEWPEMQRGNLALEAASPLEDAAARLEGFKPANAAQSNAQQASYDQLRRLFDARRQRIRQNAGSVPRVLWFALYAGAIVVLGYTFLFGVESRGAQLIMTAMLSVMIGIMFVVIFEFDRPYRGSIAIRADGWAYVRARITEVDLHRW